jgi:hypothetical protein
MKTNRGMITNSQIFNNFLSIVADRAENGEPLRARTVNRCTHALLLNYGTAHRKAIQKAMLRAIRGIEISR